jgi:hypothetical protein
VEQGLFFPNLPMQLWWRITCISPKKNICVRIRILYHIVTLTEVSLLLN